MVRAVIADDSAFLRDVLTDVLENNGISVVGAAKNGKEAVGLVKLQHPDILILDCEMPVMSGLDALKIIMSEAPLPVFMFSSLTREGAAVTIKALELGAVDFLLKPMGGAHELDLVAEELIQKIKFIVLRSRFGAFRKKGEEAPPTGKVSVLSEVPAKDINVIAMGSSTGGVQAAAEIIPRLPANSKPIVWVQHMPPNFTKSFAERLNTMSKMQVCEAKDGDNVENGVCYLAPGGFQMRLSKVAGKVKIRIGEATKVSGHCPSCNVLFESVAEIYGSKVLGIILTGMGEDGAEGLVRMHLNGAYIIGQSERSCVVYGMPKSAFIRGAVDVQLDLKNIAAAASKIQGVELDSESPLKN